MVVLEVVVGAEPVGRGVPLPLPPRGCPSGGGVGVWVGGVSVGCRDVGVGLSGLPPANAWSVVGSGDGVAAGFRDLVAGWPGQCRGWVGWGRPRPCPTWWGCWVVYPPPLSAMGGVISLDPYGVPDTPYGVPGMAPRSRAATRPPSWLTPPTPSVRHGCHPWSPSASDPRGVRGRHGMTAHRVRVDRAAAAACEDGRRRTGRPRSRQGWPTEGEQG